MADGCARVTGRPQAVIAHVDVGTQSLSAAIHNASTGRCPVLIFAGLCPFTEDGKLLGSRTEYMHWIQDALDQKAIVSQFCRYTAEFKTGSTVKQMIGRAMQFAMSESKGPVYLCGAREIMEEEVDPSKLKQEQWVPISPSALPQDAVETIVEALVRAKSPLVITGYSGRNLACPSLLVQLADAIPGLRVLDTGVSDMCFPFRHRASLGAAYSFHESTTEADVILVLDCDVPWIPARNRPLEDALIYHVDVDPLNSMMSVSFFPANGRWRAGSEVALQQINGYLASKPVLLQALEDPIYAQRGRRLDDEHSKRLASFAAIAKPNSDGTLNASCLGALVKRNLPADTVFIIEAVTCALSIADQIQAEIPGSWLNCGGTGLGWSGGAALGAKLALVADGRANFVCQIVGDGTYLETVPGSLYWVAARYGIPVLTIVLNNKGKLIVSPT